MLKQQLSPAWAFVKKDQEVIRCLFDGCGWTNTYDRTGSTSNIWRHLFNQHGVPTDEIRTKLVHLPTKTQTSILHFTPKDNHELKIFCVMMVSCNFRPFEVFKDEGTSIHNSLLPFHSSSRVSAPLLFN
jgi:hypothetical protein